MKRAVVLGSGPRIVDYQRKNLATLFGSVGHNTGNMAINFGLFCQMSPTTKYLPWGTPPQELRKAGDVLVFPMANLLGSHTDLGDLADFIDQVDMPVLGLGLGAQANSQDEQVTLKDGTLRWLQTIVRRSPGGKPNLGVRGDFTARQLSSLGFPEASLITGCPSNFINPARGLSQQISAGFSRRPRHIAVAAGIQYAPHLARIERELADIVTLTSGAYIVQHGIDMAQLARNAFDDMQPGQLEKCRDYILPNKSIDEFKTWCRQYAYAFFDVPAWIDFLRRFDFVVGTRIHGAVLAIQAGVPAGCITHDSRTAELCDTMGIPSRHYKDIGHLTQHNVMDYFNFDAEAFDATRRRLHSNFMSLYRSAGIEVKLPFRQMF